MTRSTTATTGRTRASALARPRHGDAAAVDPVAERDIRPGSTVSEAIIETATTMIVPVAKDDEVRHAAEVHPGHRVITVMPETRTARPGGRGGDVDRLALVAAGVALLAGTAQVEQRVVHAHGHADQQDHVRDAVADRRDLADRADEAEVAMTPLMASSTGMPAATSVPNASTSRMSVSGSDVVVALPMSSSKILWNASSVVAPPNGSTRSSG